MKPELTDEIQDFFAEQDARREYLSSRLLPVGCSTKRLVIEFVIYTLLLVALGYLLRAVA